MLRQTGGIVRIRFLSDGTATPARITLRHGSSTGVIAIDWLTGVVLARWLGTFAVIAPLASC